MIAGSGSKIPEVFAVTHLLRHTTCSTQHLYLLLPLQAWLDQLDQVLQVAKQLEQPPESVTKPSILLGLTQI